MKTEAEAADTTLTRESVGLGGDRAASLPERQGSMTTETLPQRCLASGGADPAELHTMMQNRRIYMLPVFISVTFIPFFSPSIFTFMFNWAEMYIYRVQS